MTISPLLAKQFDSPKDQLQSNITDNGTAADYNNSITDMCSIYLPITTDKSRQSTDKQLPTIKHLTTDSKTTDQQPIITNSNRPLVHPAWPIPQSSHDPSDDS